MKFVERVIPIQNYSICLGKSESLGMHRVIQAIPQPITPQGCTSKVDNPLVQQARMP